MLYHDDRDFYIVDEIRKGSKVVKVNYIHSLYTLGVPSYLNVVIIWFMETGKYVLFLGPASQSHKNMSWV